MGRPVIHGMIRTKTYKSWTSMRHRCGNVNADQYPRYGGIGVSVCARWESFEAFLDDMGSRPSGTTLDRIDGTKGYFKENCRWATAKEQSNNLSSNRQLTLDGKTQNLTQWAEELDLPVTTIRRRLEYGWSDERTLLTPRRSYPKTIKKQ